MSVQENIDQKLQDVMEWANWKISEGKEPPWSWYQFMKLRESIEAIRTGVMHIPMEDLQESVSPAETAHQPAASIVQLDTARRHRDNETPQQPR